MKFVQRFGKRQLTKKYQYLLYYQRRLRTLSSKTRSYADASTPLELQFESPGASTELYSQAGLFIFFANELHCALDYVMHIFIFLYHTLPYTN